MLGNVFISISQKTTSSSSSFSFPVSSDELLSFDSTSAVASAGDFPSLMASSTASAIAASFCALRTASTASESLCFLS